ncbi:MAG: hypothetical protein HFI49_00540, partial [Bacilli bacterium]|nr:hypothetical protein [Bacilli bacterium]
EQMFRLAAAHTDHPCLYVKSRPEIRSHGYGKLNKNELIACGGGNIVTTFTSLFISMVNVIKKFKVVFGGIK